MQFGNAERAVEWLFNHPDDAGEESVPASGPAPATTPGSQDVPAKYKLLGFISH